MSEGDIAPGGRDRAQEARSIDMDSRARDTTCVPTTSINALFFVGSNAVDRSGEFWVASWEFGLDPSDCSDKFPVDPAANDAAALFRWANMFAECFDSFNGETISAIGNERILNLLPPPEEFICIPTCMF